MYKKNFNHPNGIKAAAEAAAVRAGEEPNQSSYNAAYLHGYAAALKEISQSFTRQHILRFLTEADYRAMLDSIEHCENGIVEYAYCLDDTWRASRFCEKLTAQVQDGITDLPATVKTIPNVVGNYFHLKYAALVAELEKKEAAHEEDPVSAQKEFDYIRASAKVMQLCDFCNCMDLELLDENLQPIPGNAEHQTLDIADFPMWLVNRIRKEYDILLTARDNADSDDEENFVDAKVSLWEDICEEVDIDLKGDDGELLNPLEED